MFWETRSTEFDKSIIKFTHQNGRRLEIEDKVNLASLINKQKCDNILQNQKQQNMLKDMDFYHLQGNIKINY